MSIGNKVKELRKKRGLSLAELSQLTGFTRSFLSQVENEKTTPSIASLIKIANALGVVASQLFFEEGSEEKIVIRKKDREVFTNKKSRVRFERLVLRTPEKRIEPVLVHMEPRGFTGVYQANGHEFGILLKGKIELTLGGKTYVLEEGDSVYFDATTPHSWRNIYRGKSIGLWVGTSPYF
jgi:transcriptional regulator with XRE-family HTH domain